MAHLPPGTMLSLMEHLPPPPTSTGVWICPNPECNYEHEQRRSHCHICLYGTRWTFLCLNTKCLNLNWSFETECQRCRQKVEPPPSETLSADEKWKRKGRHYDVRNKQWHATAVPARPVFGNYPNHHKMLWRESTFRYDQRCRRMACGDGCACQQQNPQPCRCCRE